MSPSGPYRLASSVAVLLASPKLGAVKRTFLLCSKGTLSLCRVSVCRKYQKKCPVATWRDLSLDGRLRLLQNLLRQGSDPVPTRRNDDETNQRDVGIHLYLGCWRFSLADAWLASASPAGLQVL